MNSHGEKTQAEALVEDVFAMFDPLLSELAQPASWEAGWESGLNDFEWIEFWASLYCGELTENNSPQNTITH